MSATISQKNRLDIGVGPALVGQIYIRQLGSVIIVNKSKIAELIKQLKKTVEAS